MKYLLAAISLSLFNCTTEPEKVHSVGCHWSDEDGYRHILIDGSRKALDDGITYAIEEKGDSVLVSHKGQNIGYSVSCKEVAK